MSNFKETWYFPLYGRLWWDEADYAEPEAGGLDARELLEYREEILALVERENGSFDTPKMLAEYIHDEPLAAKILSMTPTVEVHGGQLWGAMVMEFSEPLSGVEVELLREYITGQNSDGYGEGLEQRAIPLEERELYVSFWEYGDGCRVYTPEEFARLGLAQEPQAVRKPRCAMIGANGNVFNLMGLASRALRQAGQPDAAKEMCARVRDCGSYGEALGIMVEYVEPVEVEQRRGGMEMRG